jgi:cold-inducible RNA-binding protein
LKEEAPSVAKKMYVGNLSYTANEDELRRIFEEFGNVVSAQVIMDRETGRSKGFAFVEMSSDQEAQAAISALDGKEIGGRVLKVNEARPREDRGGGGGGGRDRGGYGGGQALAPRNCNRKSGFRINHRCALPRNGDRNRTSSCGCGVLRGIWGSAYATVVAPKGCWSWLSIRSAA